MAAACDEFHVVFAVCIISSTVCHMAFTFADTYGLQNDLVNSKIVNHIFYFYVLTIHACTKKPSALHRPATCVANLYKEKRFLQRFATQLLGRRIRCGEYHSQTIDTCAVQSARQWH